MNAEQLLYTNFKKKILPDEFFFSYMSSQIAVFFSKNKKFS
jgi:hypothetical protein